MLLSELIERLLESPLDSYVSIAYDQQEPYDAIRYEDPAIITAPNRVVITGENIRDYVEHDFNRVR